MSDNMIQVCYMLIDKCTIKLRYIDYDKEMESMVERKKKKKPAGPEVDGCVPSFKCTSLGGHCIKPDQECEGIVSGRGKCCIPSEDKCKIMNGVCMPKKKALKKQGIIDTRVKCNKKKELCCISDEISPAPFNCPTVPSPLTCPAATPCPVATVESRDCEDGWVYYDAGLGCLQFTTRLTSWEMSWDDSRAFCQELNSDLVVLDTNEKILEVAKHNLVRIHNFWIGGNHRTGSWKWINGEPVDIVNIKTATQYQVINGVTDTDCLRIHKGHTPVGETDILYYTGPKTGGYCICQK